MTDIVLNPPPRRVLLVRASALIALGGVLFALVHFAALPAMRDYLASAVDRSDALSRLGVVMAWVSLVCVGLSAYLFSLGIRVLRQGRWPLHGAWVFKATRVQTGGLARLRGAALLLCALLAAACAVLALTIPSTLAAA